ncbi:MAG: DUF1631 domain-containing protein [Pseudomonadales bacterium]
MESLETRASSVFTKKAEATGLPTVVSQVRDAAISSLINHNNRLFSSCDDVFFKLAEKARSNNEQSMFFEAMREIRLKQDLVITRFKINVEQSFSKLLQVDNKLKIAPKSTSADAMDLVESEEMEATVAISSMVTRSRLDCQTQLYNLNRRFDFLIRTTEVNESNNPLDPQQIGDAFRAACEILELEITARIVLFKQFDRVVAKQLHTVIGTANQQLINAGVLPKVSRSVQKQNHSTANAPDQAQKTSTEAETNARPPQHTEFNRQFTELSQLLSSVRELALAGNLGFPLFISNGAGPAMNAEELHGILSDLQQRSPLDKSGTDLLKPQLDLRALLGQSLEERQRKGEKAKVQKSDEDVINLIAMFFDFVLDDKQLPIQIQALISRLQIPVLKIALKDKKFFNSSSHPARRLINEVVAAGIGLSDKESEAKTSLVAKISEVVHDIHDHYDEGESVFLTSLEVLRAFRKRDEQKTAKIEKRTSESAAAEAKTRHTKALIEELVLERLENVEVPKLIQSFAIDEWQQVLLLARLKHGDGSAEWTEALQTLDDLIWTSLMHKDEKSRQRLQRILPELQQRLSKWLATSLPTEDAAKERMKDISTLHERLLQASEASNVGREKLNEQQKAALHSETRSDKPWKEMTAVERQQVQYQALTYDFIQKAEDLTIGSWVMFGKTSTSDAIRCKLIAKIDTNDSFVFVNRFGFKIAEKKRKEFAYNLQQGRAKIVEHEWFFDRMMNKVTTLLSSQVHGEHTSAEPA